LPGLRYRKRGTLDVGFRQRGQQRGRIQTQYLTILADEASGENNCGQARKIVLLDRLDETWRDTSQARYFVAMQILMEAFLFQNRPNT
jgi:hypothetical protein